MSTVVQRTYRPQIAPGLPGLIVDMTSSEVITKQCEGTSGIGFGLAVGVGTKADSVVLGGTKFFGISVRDVTLARAPIDPLSTLIAEQFAVDTYQNFANMAVLTRGHIWVTAGANAAIGDALYYGGTDGGFSNSASGEAAFGSATFSTIPADGDTIVIGPTTPDTWTFKLTGNNVASKQLAILGTLGDTVRNAATILGGSVSTATANLSYGYSPPSPAGAPQGSGANTLTYAAKTVGTAGNSYTVTATGSAITTSGTSGALAGGTSSATAVPSGFWVTAAMAGQLAVVSLAIQR
jgi:hypothetical protein